MTTGFRLTLLCLVLLCLLLSLTQPAEFNHLFPIVGSGSWFTRQTEPATDAPTVSVVRSMQSSARAGPRQSLVFSCTLTVVNTGPPGWGRHRPPAVMAWRVPGPALTPATPKPINPAQNIDLPGCVEGIQGAEEIPRT
jgi:hypothetical protein